MKKTVIINMPKKEIVSLTCDVCKKEYADIYEMNEFLLLEFVAGYGSVFGDGNKVECDICQHCIRELFSSHLRISNPFLLPLSGNDNVE